MERDSRKKDPNLDGERSRREKTLRGPREDASRQNGGVPVRWMRLEKQVPLERCGMVCLGEGLEWRNGS